MRQRGDCAIAQKFVAVHRKERGRIVDAELAYTRVRTLSDAGGGASSGVAYSRSARSDSRVFAGCLPNRKLLIPLNS